VRSVLHSGRVSTRYQPKTSPYSSHSVLLSSLPADGEGRPLLDVGSGSGYLAAMLAARGFDVTAVERDVPDPGAFPANVRLVIADVDVGLPAFARPFDYIVCADVLEHLRDPLRALRELRELLTPDGALIASLPNSGNLYFRLTVLARRFPEHDRGLFDRTHLHYYTLDGWTKLLRAGGFAITTIRPTAIPVELVFPRWGDALLVRAAGRLCYDAARVWKTLFAYQFVACARRSS
jgi:SAM-dependent methyltransferase